MYCATLSICVISIIRLEALINIKFDNITYTLAPALMWTTIEPCLGIINACLPMMRPFLIQIFPKGFFVTNSKSGPSTNPKTFERLADTSVQLTPYGNGTTRVEASHLDKKDPNITPKPYEADSESTEELRATREDAKEEQQNGHLD